MSPDIYLSHTTAVSFPVLRHEPLNFFLFFPKFHVTTNPWWRCQLRRVINWFSISLPFLILFIDDPPMKTVLIRDLRCVRNTIHTNLMITYILNDLTWIVAAILQENPNKDLQEVCREKHSITTLNCRGKMQEYISRQRKKIEPLGKLDELPAIACLPFISCCSDTWKNILICYFFLQHSSSPSRFFGVNSSTWTRCTASTVFVLYHHCPDILYWN